MRDNMFRFWVVKRRFSSALYVTKDKASKHYILLTPVIDFESKLVEKEDLVKNISARRLNVDIDKLVQHWNFFKFIDERKQTMERNRNEISAKITELMKNGENHDDIEALKLHSKTIKNDLSNVKDHYYGVEEATMLKILNLPNVLHQKTPLDSEIVLYQHLEKPNSNTTADHHLKIGHNLITYLNPFACYLKSDAALFEQAITTHFRKCLLDSEYVQFSNSNFCRSIIVEGCGEDQSETLIVEKDENDRDDLSRLHLCGSSTLSSFMAYFARFQIPGNILPIKYFSTGKLYRNPKSDTASLFELSQQTALNVFITGEPKLEPIIEDLKNWYQPLGYHFRLVLVPAHRLEKAESLRLAVEMFSDHLDSYVEVGNVSFYEDYLSKRLLFTCVDGGKNGKRWFPSVTSGVVVNVPKVLACALENRKGEFLTEFLKRQLSV